MSFLATRSGLTRVRVFDLCPRIKKLADLFIQRHNRAVDESWYSRAVDWNIRHQEDATIITAPYNAYIRLIAKLRQRITQRHPAANDTRANCDPSLDSEPEISESSSSSPSNESSSQMQNDDPMASAPPPSSNQESTGAESDPEGDQSLPTVPRINYNEYSSYDFLDLLYNSSVHISATQTAIANKDQQRSPVAVTGLLYDYATFARRFLNSTSLNIRTIDSSKSRQQQQQQQADPAGSLMVDICPDGDCPTKCGYRNDTIDCMLVDNNGFIVVAEDLPHIGRSLVDYDEKLMASLVERRVFHKIQIMDYQAICTRSDAELGNQQRSSVASSLLTAGSPSSSPSSAASSSGLRTPPGRVALELMGQLASNFAAALVWLGSTALSMVAYQAGFNDLGAHTVSMLSMASGDDGQPMPWQLGATSSSFASAQSAGAIANQSLLAMLPNKTYLRPCERLVTLYETRPNELSKLANNDSPEYYATKCDCSGWYVFDAIPKTNLIMLIVNTTSACRRGCDQPSPVIVVTPPPVPIATPMEIPSSGPAGTTTYQWAPGNKTAEDQVCAMLERDAQLYWKKPDTCVAQHPDESQIQLCGGANKSTAPINLWLMLLLVSLVAKVVYKRAIL